MMPVYLTQPWISPLGKISNRSRLISHHGNYTDIESLNQKQTSTSRLANPVAVMTSNVHQSITIEFSNL